MRSTAVALVLVCVAVWVAAKEATPIAKDVVLEARMLRIAEELRCLVCQNETIAASHADLAVDFRDQIRSKLSQGQSEQQILDFMVERYGEFVRYRPGFKPATVLLWAGPFVLLAVATFAMVRNIKKRRSHVASHELSPAEKQRARELLHNGVEN